MKSVAEQMAIIRRGTVQILSEDALAQKLTRAIQTNTPLKIKAGFDPTAPDLHLGHTVLLQKMRQFQELGHEVIFLIGDFTGLIGDPTGKSETRKPLSPEAIAVNAETYKAQVFRILDPQTTRVVFNSAWMNAMTAAQMIQLAARQTVARMLERDDFTKRYKAERPIALHEFLYPLVQGYDSVALHADVELGGTDQTFNLLMGRELQKEYGQEPQCVITLPILEGLDGVQKMSKSLNNYIAIQDPPDEIFGKLMSIPDAIMWRYFDLLSDLSLEEIRHLEQETRAERFHPMEAKKQLGMELTARFHGAAEARHARERFEARFSQKEIPEDLPEISVESAGEPLGLVDAMRLAGMVASNSEGIRLVRQQAVSVGGVKADDPRLMLTPGSHRIKVGKLRHAVVVIR
ncbi:Tyrosine--tRNA ligase [Candidatus Magnetaquicoccaceae bacterium FCR-1]|uniref:Tyrosine--tRNA ligase n=1 Tax=Candidatus Magnetaquiglobus chichijimensis TaxID=3141448 RepID=A0ABQ0CC43_9PROT